MSNIRLAYVGATTKDLSAWKTFGTEVMGLEVGKDSNSKLLYLRADERHHRLSIHPGDNEDISYVGWELSSSTAIQAAAALLEKEGIKVQQGTPEEAADRRVLQLYYFKCPYTDVRMELTLGGETVFSPKFKPTRDLDAFLTGDLGMGHVVLYSTNPSEAAELYVRTLGFGISDFAVSPDGHVLGAFLHCNPRHHSLAFFGVPMGPRGKRVQHIMFENSSMDDVGNTYDLCLERKLNATSLGKHPNDRALSFYFINPSSWLFEYGWNLRRVDPDNWVPDQYVIRPGNAWGHSGLWNLEKIINQRK